MHNVKSKDRPGYRAGVSQEAVATRLRELADAIANGQCWVARIEEGELFLSDWAESRLNLVFHKKV